MNGFRVASNAVVVEMLLCRKADDDVKLPPLIENADAELAVRARRESAWNFMFDIVFCVV